VRRREQSKQQEQQKKHKWSSLKSLSTWRGFDPLIVSWSVCLCSSIECEGLKTWMAWMVVVGGYIYSPNHYSSRCCRWAHRTVRWCTGHSTIHCPVCATSADRWGLEWLTVEVLCPLGAPNSLVCSNSANLTSDFCTIHCSFHQRSRSLGAVDRCSVSSLDSLVHTGQSGEL
jgi:hypothetical protein